MERFVGLVIISKDTDGECLALLQKRANFNSERGIRESYPGCFQVSCYGEVEANETFYQALVREWSEELGGSFAKLCQSKGSPPIKISDICIKGKRIMNFGVFVPREWEEMIRTGKDVGSILWVCERRLEEIRPTTPNMISKGAPDEENLIVMFPEAIEATKKAFELFRVQGQRR